jgi:hypothetical protein
MTKKNWALLSTLVVLAAAYVFYFTDWFVPKTIVIHHISRESRTFRRPSAAPLAPTIPVTFGLENNYRFTELKVVALEAWQTNQNTLPLWHLVSSSNSVPLKQFVYGRNIPGMKPAMLGTHAEELQPGVTYRLFVTAGSASGHHDFQPIALSGRR